MYSAMTDSRYYMDQLACLLTSRKQSYSSMELIDALVTSPFITLFILTCNQEKYKPVRSNCLVSCNNPMSQDHIPNPLPVSTSGNIIDQPLNIASFPLQIWVVSTATSALALPCQATILASLVVTQVNTISHNLDKEVVRHIVDSSSSP